MQTFTVLLGNVYATIKYRSICTVSEDIMKFKRVLLCLVSIFLFSFGVSFTLKAAIGVGSWDAITQTVSDISRYQIGTVGIALNAICILIQFVLLGKDFKFKHAMQVVLIVSLGYAINFVYYDLLPDFTITSYPAKLFFLILGTAINALAVSIVMLVDVVTFALEGASLAIAKSLKMDFPLTRQIIDAVIIVITVILSLLFSTPLTVREGTVIGMLIFSPLMGFFMKILKPIFRKHDLTDQ